MIFQDIDVDHNGLISKEELYQSNTIKNKVIDYLKVLPSKKAEKEVERIFK
jgi:Ca2+-binding EF-hand superfamily protein